jgi:hypothetical protein
MKNKKPTFEMGTTFWTNPKHPTHPSHLHIVISDPAKNTGEIAVVNVTTLRGEFDPSCILEAKCHKAIRVRSFVPYFRAWVVNLNVLTQLFDAGQIHRDDLMSAEMLRRVQQGAMTSKATPIRIKGILAEQGLT